MSFKVGAKLIITVDEPNETTLVFGECVTCEGSLDVKTSFVTDTYGDYYEVENRFLKEDNEYIEDGAPMVARNKPLIDVKELSTITFYANGKVVLYGNRAHQIYPKLNQEYLKAFRDAKYFKIRKVSFDGNCAEFAQYEDIDECLKDMTVKDVLLIHEDQV